MMVVLLNILLVNVLGVEFVFLICESESVLRLVFFREISLLVLLILL